MSTQNLTTPPQPPTAPEPMAKGCVSPTLCSIKGCQRYCKFTNLTVIEIEYGSPAVQAGGAR